MNINLISGVTIAICFRLNSQITYDRLCGFIFNTGNTDNAFELVINGTSLQLWALGNSGSSTIALNVNTITLPANGIWSYFVVRFKSTTAVVNNSTNQLTYTPTLANVTNFTASKTRCGGSYVSNSYATPYRLDVRDFMFYDRFLLDSDVNALISKFRSDYNMT